MALVKGNPFSFWMRGASFSAWAEMMDVTVTDGPPELVWIDTETTGLESETEVTLAAGLILTDRAGNVCRDSVADWIVYDNGEDTYKKNAGGYKNWSARFNGMSAYVEQMHRKSGLFRSIVTASMHPQVQMCAPYMVSVDMHDWLNERFGQESVNSDIKQRIPMSGSSPQFDRAFVSRDLGYLNSWFHYRSGVDVSAMREVAKLVNPSVIDTQPKSMEVHMPIPDLVDSIKLYKHLLNNFIAIDDATKELLK